jgi:hypothetical protein
MTYIAVVEVIGLVRLYAWHLQGTKNLLVCFELWYSSSVFVLNQQFVKIKPQTPNTRLLEMVLIQICDGLIAEPDLESIFLIGQHCCKVTALSAKPLKL